MVDTQRVDDALGDQPEHEPVRLREHRRVLLADPGEIVDVKKAAVLPGHRVDVEEALAQLGVGPEAVALVGGHVVGDDVEHQPQAGGVGGVGERPKLVLAAEVARDPGRVDHVVAVGRAGPRLQRRRQVDVRDAQVTQVRDQRLRCGEPELRGQLQAVGGPEGARLARAQVARLRIVIECAVTLISPCAS